MGATATGGVLSLTYRQVDRQLDPILEPARGAAAALAVALPDHARLFRSGADRLSGTIGSTAPTIEPGAEARQ